MVALWPVAQEISALALLAIVNVVLWTLIAIETRSYGEARYRFRHGLEVEIPSRRGDAESMLLRHRLGWHVALDAGDAASSCRSGPGMPP